MGPELDPGREVTISSTDCRICRNFSGEGGRGIEFRARKLFTNFRREKYDQFDDDHSIGFKVQRIGDDFRLQDFSKILNCRSEWFFESILLKFRKYNACIKYN